MENKKKIIISITGLALIALTLLGLTYAYYRTRVIGNTKDKSISVTSKKLELEYVDGNSSIELDSIIEPSDTVYTKEFTVKNNGDDSLDYEVHLINVVNTFKLNDDIKYTVSCTSDGVACNGVDTETTFPKGNALIVSNNIESKKTHTYTLSFTYKDSGEDQSVDMGATLRAKIQIFSADQNGNIIPFDEGTLAYNILNNAINMEESQEILGYAIYRETPVTTTDSVDVINYNKVDATGEELFEPMNQSYEMSDEYSYDSQTKTYSLENPVTVEFDFESGPVTEAKNYFILNGELVKYAGFSYMEINYYKTTPSISVAESSLIPATDDYGTTYYFRGGVENNYVNFNNMCWKIARIQGDGSIKLSLASPNGNCSSNILTNTSGLVATSAHSDYNYYMDSDYLINEEEVFEGSPLDKDINTWYSNNLSNVNDYLKNENWCYQNGMTTSLICSSRIADNDYYRNIGILTAGEYKIMGVGANSYLTKNNYTNYEDADGLNTTFGAILLTSTVNLPSEGYLGDGTSYIVDSNSGVFAFSTWDTVNYINPIIVLKSGTLFTTGDGTLTSPYVIN